eukprot:jgi/Mesvir1/11651/Mv00051-RA.1
MGQSSSGRRRLDADSKGRTCTETRKLPCGMGIRESCSLTPAEDVKLDSNCWSSTERSSAGGNEEYSVLISTYEATQARLTDENAWFKKELISFQEREKQLIQRENEFEQAIVAKNAEQSRLSQENANLRSQLSSALHQADTLRHQLSVAEQNAASDPAKMGGSYSESCAIPTEFGAGCDRVHNAMNMFCTKVIGSVWKAPDGQLLLQTWLLSALGLPSAPPIPARRFAKLALMGLLSQVAFLAFENESFYSRGSSCLLLDRKERAAHFEQRYSSLSTVRNEQRLLESLPLEERARLDSWWNDLRGRLFGMMGPCPVIQQAVFGEHIEQLVAVAWNTWHLHVLAYAFEVPPEVVWRVAGDKASPACVEHEDDWGQRDASTHLVAFTVFPGFRLGKSHLLKKCRVVLQWPHVVPPQQPPCGRPDGATLSAAGATAEELTGEHLAAMNGVFGEGVGQQQQPGGKGLAGAQATLAATYAPRKPQAAPSCAEGQGLAHKDKGTGRALTRGRSGYPKDRKMDQSPAAI